MRKTFHAGGSVLILWMFLPQTAWARLVIDDGPEIIKTKCEGAYRVKATRPPPMPGGGGGAGGTYVPVPGVILRWKVIPAVGGGSFTTPMPTVTNAAGHAFATYRAPDTTLVGHVKLQASGVCPPGSGKNRKSGEEEIRILGNPPVGIPSPQDFLAYFLTGRLYLNMRYSMNITNVKMQQMKKTIDVITPNNAVVDFGFSLPPDACGYTDVGLNASGVPPGNPPYPVKIAGANSCMTDVTKFVETYIHEARHVQCALIYRKDVNNLSGPPYEGDSDGDGYFDNDLDLVADVCDKRPNKPTDYDPLTGAPIDEEDHVENYAKGRIPKGCP